MASSARSKWVEMVYVSDAGKGISTPLTHPWLLEVGFFPIVPQQNPKLPDRARAHGVLSRKTLRRQRERRGVSIEPSGQPHPPNAVSVWELTRSVQRKEPRSIYFLSALRPTR